MEEAPVTEPQSVSLNNVVQAFERWRQKRMHREAIPAELWDAALSLIPSYPATKVAQMLHLNYAKLRDRMKGGKSSISSRKDAPWPFVELGLPVSGACVEDNQSRIVIEIEKPSGRFRCTVTGVIPDNLLTWFRQVMEGR